MSWNTRPTKFNSSHFLQIAQLQKFTVECFPRYWSLKIFPEFFHRPTRNAFSYLATVHQNLPGPGFLPLTCLARHLWSLSLKFCYLYFNSTKPRWFTLLGLLGEKLILVNLNSESFPLKNILNDIKKFKIKKNEF